MQAPSHLQERHHLIGAPGHSLGKQTTPQLKMKKIIFLCVNDDVVLPCWLLRCCYAPSLHSALHYEVLLKESRPANEQGSPHRHHSSKTTPTGPTQERIDTCFQVFGTKITIMLLTPPPAHDYAHDYKYTRTHADDLLVHLGVYQRVMKLVRDELYGM